MMCAEQPVAKPMPTCTGMTPPPDGGPMPAPADARPDVKSDATSANDTRPDAGGSTPDTATPADTSATPEVAADVNQPPFSMPDARLPPANPGPGPDAGKPGSKPDVVPAEGCGCAAGGQTPHSAGMLFAALVVLVGFRRRTRTPRAGTP
jgi:MYXO-CTERM domain-containing protein